MSKKTFPVMENLIHVLDTMDKMGQFVGDMDLEDFQEDDKTIFAVSKAIEIIGEMLKRFPQEIKEQYPAVPWQDIYGMRNFLAHNYFGSDKDEIWKKRNPSFPKMAFK